MGDGRDERPLEELTWGGAVQGPSQPEEHRKQGGLQGHAHCHSAHHRLSDGGDRAPSHRPAEALPVCSTQLLAITWKVPPPKPQSPPREADREVAGGNWWGALWEGFLEVLPRVRGGTTAGLGGAAAVLPHRPTGCPQGGWLSWSPAPPTSTQGTSGEGR